MHLGSLEVVRQEMARVNTDILGISELKWTGSVFLTTLVISNWERRNTLYIKHLTEYKHSICYFKVAFISPNPKLWRGKVSCFSVDEAKKVEKGSSLLWRHLSRSLV